ncbi:MAG TPA: RNA polymerase sigma factor [Phycisphaerales bacterium]|nr:RNA polymerase sigma factor [Phycisphaerales bacterium]
MRERADIRVNDPAGARETDRALAVRASSKDLAAFTHLVERFEERLFNFLLRRVHRRADAEDLTQETFLRAWKHIGSYQPDHAFSTWLFTIGSRLATDLLTSSARKRMKTGVEIDVQSSENTSAATRSHEHQAGGDLWALAKRLLNDEQHSALWLRYAEDCSVREIAEILGRGQIHVRVMLHRARKTLEHHADGSGTEREPTLARRNSNHASEENIHAGKMLVSTGSTGAP